MKHLLILLMVMLSFTACASNNFSRLIDQPAPETRVTLMEGGALPLDSFRGQTTVLLFWATTCNASRKVVEDINELAAKHANSAKFVAISLDREGDVERLRQRINGSGLHNLTHAFSGNEAWDEAFLAFGLEYLPAIIVIDPSGKVVSGGNSESAVSSVL